MIDILHIITGLESGGAEAMVSKVALDLHHRGHKVQVVSLGGPGFWGPRLAERGVLVTSLNLGARRPWNALQTLALIDKPNVIQGWMYHGNLAAWALARLWSKPFAWNVRATWDATGFGNSGTLKIMHLNKFLSAPGLPILCNSRVAMQSHLKVGFSGDWQVIPNGFDLDVFRPNPAGRVNFRRSIGLGDEDLVVGMAARMHAMKDHAGLMKAWAIVQKVRPEAHLVLVGSGIAPDNVDFRHMADQAGVSRNLHLLGPCGDMAAFQASLDLAVLSSAYGEAFPNVLGEAMACGVPCVATSVGDSADIVGDTGLIVPPGNPRQLAEAILQILDLPQLARLDRGRAGRDRIRTLYSIQAVTNEYEELYTGMV